MAPVFFLASSTGAGTLVFVGGVDDCVGYAAACVGFAAACVGFSVAYVGFASAYVGFAGVSVGFAEVSAGFAEGSVGFAEASVDFADASVGFAGLCFTATGSGGLVANSGASSYLDTGSACPRYNPDRISLTWPRWRATGYRYCYIQLVPWQARYQLRRPLKSNPLKTSAK